MARLVADLQKRMERTEVRTCLLSEDFSFYQTDDDLYEHLTVSKQIALYQLLHGNKQKNTAVSVTNMDLSLLQPVTVVKDISDQSVFTNKVAVFECEIKINYPEITLSWYKGTQKLDTNDKYDISIIGDRHLLKIKRCQASDQGNYRVVCVKLISLWLSVSVAFSTFYLHMQ